MKIVREKKYDEVLGVHIIGPHATDLIAEACVALQLEATAEELFRTIHAHPTLSEAVMRSGPRLARPRHPLLSGAFRRRAGEDRGRRPR